MATVHRMLLLLVPSEYHEGHTGNLKNKTLDGTASHGCTLQVTDLGILQVELPLPRAGDGPLMLALQCQTASGRAGPPGPSPASLTRRRSESAESRPTRSPSH